MELHQTNQFLDSGTNSQQNENSTYRIGENTACDSLRPLQLELGRWVSTASPVEPSGPNQHAVQRGSKRATQIKRLAPWLERGTGVTNRSGEEGDTGLSWLQHDTWRA